MTIFFTMTVTITLTITLTMTLTITGESCGGEKADKIFKPLHTDMHKTGDGG